MTKVKEFRKKYKEAESSGVESFEVDGHVFLTSYAKYMCEYFDLQGLKPDQNISFVPSGGKDD